jgi:hypothetical protein
MGLFLGMSGVSQAELSAVERSLRDFAAARHGTVKKTPVTDKTWEVLILAEAKQGRTTVIYPGDCLLWEEASEHLSRSLRTSVMSLHIHDED